MKSPRDHRRRIVALAFAFALGALPSEARTGGGSSAAARPAGELGGPGLALSARKALVVPLEGPQIVDDALVLVKDGKIEAVGTRDELQVPEGYELVDVGENWLMPGMVDLHCHIAGSLRDLNDMVYLTNPEVRACATVDPRTGLLRRGVAGGVTSVLLIPGSGTNMGGQGVLLKTGLGTYEEMVIRNPGSLKLAQAGNPEGYVWGVGRSFMNWNTRNTFVRGIAYAKQWEAFEKGAGPEPEKDLQFEVFRKLYKRECQVSTHTQIYQVVNATLTIVAEELGLPVYIDHGTFDSWRAAKRAKELGVSAIVGPRNIDVPTRLFINWSGSNPERIQGSAAGFQEQGHTMIGFNTDSPVVPQEEFSLQAAMGVRYGMTYRNLETVRGLTIIPAVTAGIQARVGSLEVGKDADILVVTGDPADPRHSVETVWIQGQRVYDVRTNGRQF